MIAKFKMETNYNKNSFFSNLFNQKFIYATIALSVFIALFAICCLHAFNPLPALLLFPLAPIILLCFIQKQKIVQLRLVSLGFSIVIFIWSLLTYIFFDGWAVGFQFPVEINWFSTFNISFNYGVDGVSLFFIILTTFLIPVCILSSWESIQKSLKEFFIMLFLIEFFLIQVFSVLDLVLFYIFFEAILIPMFIMIGVWGSRSRKIHAAYQFFLYTFFGSVLMLLGIFFIYNSTGTTDYVVLLRTEFMPTVQLFLWLAFFISFMIKIPLIPLHIWLPEAHVEAPTAGSVLLAGILLKLGTYGLLRFSIPLFPFASQFFTPLIFTISIMGIVYTSCTTIRQIDLKKIIAYSSVAHMSLVTVGLFSNSIVGVEGALALMLSHGLVSSGLFLCVGVLYDRYKTRLIRYYGGLVAMMPNFAVVFMIFSLANMGLPLTSAFVGEFAILLGAFNANTLVAVGASLGVIFSAAYSTWLYNRVMFGPVNENYINYHADLNRREIFFMGLLVILVIYFGLFPNAIFSKLHFSVTNIHASTLNWPIYQF
uniref:NADH-ubiquinone oxidoreductase chain 4 n=1 Tax=Phalansterium sp. PJK-2012 TaxID=1267188 RepID=T1QE56_9EUKA|nr:NADH dehydrogenase subunit 4 [Phalansterium sp. PJK-2012]